MGRGAGAPCGGGAGGVGADDGQANRAVVLGDHTSLAGVGLGPDVCAKAVFLWPFCDGPPLLVGRGGTRADDRQAVETTRQ